VTFMDASTVGALVGSRNRLRRRGQSIRVRAPSMPALRVLEMCSLTDLVHASAPEAVVPTALATWVDVPAHPTRAVAIDSRRSDPHHDEAAAVEAGRSHARVATEVDRGGP
jgi:hypothetical protein